MDAKKLLLEHFEKLALGLVGLILVVFVATTLLTPQLADAAAGKVAKAVKKIGRLRDLATTQARQPETPTYAKQVGAALDGGPAPERAPGWLFHRRPVVVTKVEGVPVPEPKASPPQIEAPKGDLGRIGIRWGENPANHLVLPEGWDVYRAEGEPRTWPLGWKKITAQPLPRAQTSFTDGDVRTKVKYFYLIEQRASVDREQPAVKRALDKTVVVLPDEMVVLRSDVIGPITTLPDVRLEVISVVLKPTPDEVRADPKSAERKPSAFIMVWKYFPEDGEWLKWSYSEVKVQEKIGREESVRGKKRDFASGYTLVATKRVRVKKPGTELEIEADAIVVEDESRQPTELNSIEVDPELDKIKKNPKPGSESDEGAAGKEDPKKKPGPK